MSRDRCINVVYTEPVLVLREEKKHYLNERRQWIETMNRNLQLDFDSGKNTKTWEDVPIAWKEVDTIVVFSPHHDPIAITSDIGGQNIGNLSIDERGGSSILFAKCYRTMKIHEAIVKTEFGDLLGLDGHKTKTRGGITPYRDNHEEGKDCELLLDRLSITIQHNPR